ncbi:MAG: conjugal transfer protein TraJ [Myxococcales bacterium]|nr:conjugal transfer protein TraJ [Myxococcales bacterium]
MSNAATQQTRLHRLKTSVNDEEKAAIEACALQVGMSVSAYLRVVGLGYSPPARIDRVQVAELAKVNADLGRLGGLLKAWLVQHPDIRQPMGDMRPAVRRALHAIELTQVDIRQGMERVVATLGRAA